MKQFLLSTPAQLVIWLSVLAILIALGAYVVGRFRGQSDDEQLTANELLSNFRELREQGDIDAGEFRNIKTVLGVQLHQELNVSARLGSAKPSGEGKVGQSDGSGKAG